jgi:hypothetical protein
MTRKKRALWARYNRLMLHGAESAFASKPPNWAANESGVYTDGETTKNARLSQESVSRGGLGHA